MLKPYGDYNVAQNILRKVNFFVDDVFHCDYLWHNGTRKV
jgi:hypothetical protein